MTRCIQDDKFAAEPGHAGDTTKDFFVGHHRQWRFAKPYAALLVEKVDGAYGHHEIEHAFRSVVLLDFAVRDPGLRQRELFGHRVKGCVVFFCIARQMIQPDCLLRSAQGCPETEDAFTTDLEYGLALEVEIAEDLAASPGIVEVLVPKAHGVSQPPNTLLLASCGFTGYNLVRSGHWSGLHGSECARALSADFGHVRLGEQQRAAKRMQVPCHREPNDRLRAKAL